MYRSTKENHGKYNIATYIQRGMELCSPKEFSGFRKRYLPNQGSFKSFLMLLDYYTALIKHGATVCDFFEYQFWKKSNVERAEYVTMLFSRKIQKRYNSGDIEVFIDKVKFNKAYADFRSIKSFEMNPNGGVNLSLLSL